MRGGTDDPVRGLDVQVGFRVLDAFSVGGSLRVLEPKQRVCTPQHTQSPRLCKQSQLDICEKGSYVECRVKIHVTTTTLW